MKCFKCGAENRILIKHHISYFPEKIVDCCWSCHTKIHNKVRERELCPLAPSIVKKLSTKSTFKDAYHIVFEETLIPNVRLKEDLIISNRHGTITWSSYFLGNHGIELYEIDEAVQNKAII